MNKLVEIMKAWIASYNPTPEELSRATERLSICNSCEHKSSLIFDELTICNICTCPLSKKIYSPVEEACPLDKWPHNETSVRDKTTILTKHQ